MTNTHSCCVGFGFAGTDKRVSLKVCVEFSLESHACVL
jgi:hypothetical protein